MSLLRPTDKDSHPQLIKQTNPELNLDEGFRVLSGINFSIHEYQVKRHFLCAR